MPTLGVSDGLMRRGDLNMRNSAVDPANFMITTGESDSSTNHSVYSLLEPMSGKSWLVRAKLTFRLESNQTINTNSYVASHQSLPTRMPTLGVSDGLMRSSVYSLLERMSGKSWIVRAKLTFRLETSSREKAASVGVLERSGTRVPFRYQRVE
jgi:hypothetical protein